MPRDDPRLLVSDTLSGPQPKNSQGRFLGFLIHSNASAAATIGAYTPRRKNQEVASYPLNIACGIVPHQYPGKENKKGRRKRG